jgi:glutamate-ammonia-ligase adenylyltransferase
MQFDNSISERYTVFTIRAQDTPGFLYELAHALALNDVSIGCVELRTIDGIARDTLYVTDQQGCKITDANTLQQLRTTTVLIKHFTHLLPDSPNPASALLHFREFLAQLAARPDWPSELATLEQTHVLDALARLLGVSDFLWNDFLRMQHASLFPIVRDVATHSQRVSQAEMQEQLNQALVLCSKYFQRIAVLETFRDREMFRVDMRHILGHIPEFGDFSAELTDVAEVVVAGALELCLDDLRTRHGDPMLAPLDPQGTALACPLSLCALGKCGGRELGFASDIELMLIYAGAGQTSGPHPISNKEFCIKLVERLTQILRTRREGIFEIDWRLRPYGRAGFPWNRLPPILLPKARLGRSNARRWSSCGQLPVIRYWGHKLSQPVTMSSIEDNRLIRRPCAACVSGKCSNWSLRQR